MTRSYTPSQIADGLLAGEFTRDSAFVPLAEVERLTRERAEARAVVSTLEIVGKAADDERARMQKEIERLHKAHEAACRGGELLRGEVERLRAEIVSLEATGAEASDEIDRLRAALEAKP